MFCNACGTRVGEMDRHCPNCGRGLKSRGASGGSSKGKEPSASQSLSPSSAQMPALGKSQSDSKSPAKATAATRISGPAARSGPSGGASSAAVAGGGVPDIRSLLWETPGELEAGLTVYKDAKSKPVGIRYECEVGQIDLLARDNSGGLVVVMVANEKEKGGKELVSDALERIGWVRLQVAQSGQEVRAIVLTGSVPDDLSYAAAAVSGTVSFKTYRVAVAFEDVMV